MGVESHSPASFGGLRLVQATKRPSPRRRPPVKATGSERWLASNGNGATRSPQVGDNLWRRLHLTGETRAKARSRGSRWSNDGRHLGRSQARTSSRRLEGGGPWPSPTPRKRVVQGHVSPTLSRSLVRARVRAAGSSEAHRVILLRRDGHGRRTAPGSPLGAPRSRDRRCPSGSGWGEAPVADMLSSASSATCVEYAWAPDGRRRAAKAGRPLTRETSAGAERRVGWGLGPTRCRPCRAARLDEAGASHGTTRIRWSARRMASNPFGGFLPVRRKLGALRRRARTGIGRSCGCARGLFWLQKSTRGTWSKSAPTMGNRRGRRWV